jgi:hypothetical protein
MPRGELPAPSDPGSAASNLQANPCPRNDDAKPTRLSCLVGPEPQESTPV